MMRLKTISIIGERIAQPDEYPFNIPTIASLKTLEITSPICFFVGENGTGKSTLLEAIAAHYGFGLEGGNRNFSPKTTDSVTSIEPLVKALRLSFTKRTGGGFYLRAESFFNVASYVDLQDTTNCGLGCGLEICLPLQPGRSVLSEVRRHFAWPPSTLLPVE